MSSTLPTHQTAVIFGAGEAGVAAFELLKNDYHIVAFVDNDPAKHGTKHLGMPILSIEDDILHQVDKILIASEYAEQISRQLAQRSFSESVEVLASRYLKAADFSQDSVREKASLALMSLCQYLNTTAVRYYVDAGTLLGIVRDEALIPWDDDLDIALHADDLVLFQSHLPMLLSSVQKELGETYKVVTHHCQTTFGAVVKGAVRSLKMIPADSASNMPMIDIFVKYIAGDNMDYCLASRGIRMPAMHFDSCEAVLFKGQSIKLPNEYKAYLRTHYGDWETPKPDWSLSELKNATLF